MKKIILLSLVMLSAIVSTEAQQLSLKTEEPNAVIFNAPSFKWENPVYEFGKIERDKPVTVTFTFTNNGSKPLVISGASTSCGCTASDFSREPVAPGKQGHVKVIYNAATPGNFLKTINVTSNVEGAPEVLTIKGEVVVK